jgi:hypothetical protein
MNPMSTDAIADFLRKGGKVVKVQETIPVTAAEVVDYLVTCGFDVKNSPGNAVSYKYEGKLVSVSKLVELANQHRRSHDLPPFAARVNINVSCHRKRS